MPRAEKTDSLESDSAAFEYVLGTLRGQTRTHLEAKLHHDKTLQEAVSLWEEELVALNKPELTRTPSKDNWSVIESKIKPSQHSSNNFKQGLQGRRFWLPWAISSAFAVLLLMSIIIPPTGLNPTSDLPVDYIAVMTTTEGTAILSTVAKGDDQKMWLHWGDETLAADQDYQLWAVSRSDGETRSISVIANNNTKLLDLPEAEWRLIKDAESLLLTIEDEGGSAIDEPSEVLVAKGLCVRLTQDDHDV